MLTHIGHLGKRSSRSNCHFRQQAVTYTITNAIAGYFYGIADGTTGRSLATGVWAPSNGNLSITTSSFNSSGTYSPVLKTTSLSGVTLCYSTLASATVIVSGTLPIHFLNISANRSNGGVNVTWSVSDEVNVAYYMVERSFDCSRFENAGQVNYKDGNSTKDYSFIDPVQASSTICYRIKQVDYNGNYQYSRVVIVRADDNSSMQIIPNPAAEEAKLMVGSSREETGNLDLIDINGKIIQRENSTVKEREQYNSDFRAFVHSKGDYLLKLSTSSGVRFEKLITQ